MKKCLTLFLIVSFVAIFSCTRKDERTAAEMIVGNWEMRGNDNILEFHVNGTLRLMWEDEFYEGQYYVDGPYLYTEGYLPIGNGHITYISDQYMRIDFYEVFYDSDYYDYDYGYHFYTFYRTSDPIPSDIGGGGNNEDGNSYKIEVAPNPSDGGYVIGAGYYYEYDICTLTAVANSGYVFTNWTENGEVVSTDDYYSFTVTGDRNFVANFETAYIPGEGARISVTGDCWFVLDHQYSDGETIRLENATFGLCGAIDDGWHQQLIGGGEEGSGDRLRIGQAECHLYFNLGDVDLYYLYGQVTSIADGYFLDNADIVFSPSSLYINGGCVVSYSTKHLDLSTDMCLFANNESGWDVVHNQTATLGTVTITNANGHVTAKYIPTLDERGTPCFYNSVSGAYIYHSGSGTPIFKNE